LTKKVEQKSQDNPNAPLDCQAIAQAASLNFDQIFC